MLKFIQWDKKCEIVNPNDLSEVSARIHQKRPRRRGRRRDYHIQLGALCATPVSSLRWTQEPVAAPTAGGDMDNSSLSSRRNIASSSLILPNSAHSSGSGTPLDAPQPPPIQSLPSSASDLVAPSLQTNTAGSGQMYIKRHVRRRLQHAKESCDKELKNIVHSITAYVEERIQDNDYDELGSAIAASDAGSDDGGDDADLDIPATRHARHCTFILAIYS